VKQLVSLTPAQLKSIERTLSGGTWTITFGAVLFSVLTVTPLVQRVTSDGWDWTAPILPIVVDAAVVIVVRLDATVSRLGERGGRWPGILRWLTGCMTLALNIGDSALKGDKVGVAVHAVAPMLLIVTAEAALAYRRAISRALDRIDREQREADERERREHREQVERERRERAEREQAERAEREQEREARERQEREAREHQLQQEREHRAAERELREFEAAQQREREERQARERREAAERERRDRQEREERERQEREQREREAQEAAEREREEKERQRQERKARREHSREPVRGGVREGVRAQTSRPSANTKKDKLPEDEARAVVAAGVANGTGVRELERRTGWSVAWVSERAKEVREQRADEHPAGPPAPI
jgi:uncharacterized protein DUF2637